MSGGSPWDGYATDDQFEEGPMKTEYKNPPRPKPDRPAKGSKAYNEMIGARIAKLAIGGGVLTFLITLIAVWTGSPRVWGTFVILAVTSFVLTLFYVFWVAE